MPSSPKRKKLSPSLVGAGIGFIVSLAIIIWSYNYAVANDPTITSFLFYLIQKPYRLPIQFPAQLSPIAIGYLLGKEREEKARIRLVAQENKYLYEQTLKKQRALDQLMHRISQAHEEERRRISRELHDGIAQNLSGVILNLSSLKREIKEEVPEGQIEELEALVKETIVDLRRMINDLKPTTLDSLGLIPTLEKHLEGFEKENKIKTFLKNNLTQRIPAALEIATFRIIQEALNNIKKHAQASQVKISIERDNKAVNLTLEDNGRGFDLEDVTQFQKGFGLTSMRERTESFGGNLNILTQSGEGTKITAIFPLSVPMEIE